MRGVPGTGKTTYVKKHYPNATVCSADDFFNERAALNGTSYEEEFQPWLIGEAHQYCWYKFIHAVCLMDKRLVVIDNTNIKKWEYDNYVFLAELMWRRLMTAQRLKNAVEPIITIIEIPFEPGLAEVYHERNVHGVPLESIQRMMDNYEHEDLS